MLNDLWGYLRVRLLLRRNWRKVKTVVLTYLNKAFAKFVRMYSNWEQN